MLFKHMDYSEGNIYRYFLFITILPLWFLVSCDTESVDIPEVTFEGSWKFVGVDTLRINNIRNFDGELFLATDQGIWTETQNSFQLFGLPAKKVINVLNIEPEIFIAGVRASDFSGGDTTIFRTTNNGTTWKPFMGNFGGVKGKFTFIDAMKRDPTNPNIVYARGGANVSKTTNGGQTWESVYRSWEDGGADAPMLKIDSGNSEIIWAGGATATFEPYLIRSKDSGKNWVQLKEKIQVLPNKTFEATVHDIAIRSGQSSHLLLGLNTGLLNLGILRSTDFGESWELVQEEVQILTLENSSRSQFMVYGSGRISTDRLFFVATPDFGDSWETIVFENSPSNIIVHDLLATETGGKEVLYFGTNKGLFSYTFVE